MKNTKNIKKKTKKINSSSKRKTSSIGSLSLTPIKNQIELDVNSVPGQINQWQKYEYYTNKVTVIDRENFKTLLKIKWQYFIPIIGTLIFFISLLNRIQKIDRGLLLANIKFSLYIAIAMWASFWILVIIFTILASTLLNSGAKIAVIFFVWFVFFLIIEFLPLIMKKIISHLTIVKNSNVKNDLNNSKVITKSVNKTTTNSKKKTQNQKTKSIVMDKGS